MKVTFELSTEQAIMVDRLRQKTEAERAEQAAKMFSGITALCANPQCKGVAPIVNGHIMARTGHPRLVNYHNNGADDLEKIVLYDEVLRGVRRFIDGAPHGLLGDAPKGGIEVGATPAATPAPEVAPAPTITPITPPPTPPAVTAEADSREADSIVNAPGADDDDAPDVGDLGKAIIDLVRKNVKVEAKGKDEELRRKVADLEQDIEAAETAIDNNRKEIISQRAVVEQCEQTVQGLPDIIREAVEQQVAESKRGVEDLEQAVERAIKSAYGQALAKQIESGEQVPLPALRSVDPYFVENSCTRSIEQSVADDDNIIVSGPAGSGKTFPIEQVLRKLQRRYLGPVSLGDGMTRQDFMARQILKEKDGKVITEWRYGFLPFAMMNGLVLILDEISQLQREMLSNLYYAIEYKTLYLPETGEEIQAKPGFLVMATDNALRDTTGGYSGFGLSYALTNRFSFVASDYLSPSEESEIFCRIGLRPNDADKLAAFLSACRGLYNGGSLNFAPSTRIGRNIAFKVKKGRSWEEAISRHMLDALTPTERTAVDNIRLAENLV